MALAQSQGGALAAVPRTLAAPGVLLERVGVGRWETNYFVQVWCMGVVRLPRSILILSREHVLRTSIRAIPTHAVRNVSVVKVQSKVPKLPSIGSCPAEIISALPSRPFWHYLAINDFHTPHAARYARTLSTPNMPIWQPGLFEHKVLLFFNSHTSHLPLLDGANTPGTPTSDFMLSCSPGEESDMPLETEGVVESSCLAPKSAYAVPGSVLR